MVEKQECFQAIGVQDFDQWLRPKLFTYSPRPLRSCDIDIKIIACSVCGSDIHTANGDWGKPFVPMAVGHEIIGHIVQIGDSVNKRKFHIGQRVGVGPECDSCGKCWRCKNGYQNNCHDQTGTYGFVTKDGYHTQGGYANYVRVNSEFVYEIPDSLSSIDAAPLLCAGVTGFRPLMKYGVTKGSKVAVSGIGGVGHLTVQFAKALGAEVTVISRSDEKRDMAKKLGADNYISTSNPHFPDKYTDTLDLIINTASTFGEDQIESIMSMLKPDGKFIFITMPKITDRLTLSPFFLCSGNYLIGGTCIGAPHETEEMLKVAAKHNIKPWIETLDINEENVTLAWKRMLAGDVRFRIVFTGYEKFFK